jgi:hypothetical protein
VPGTHFHGANLKTASSPKLRATGGHHCRAGALRDERELGRVAARQLLDALRDGAQRRSVEIRLPVELTIRRSCGCGSSVSDRIAA